MNSGGERGSKLCVKLLHPQKLLAVSIASALATASVASAAEQSQATLTQQARITKAHAEQIALSKVQHGRVQSAEIENERGHLVWSFDIATPHTRDITEILVDAKSGKIISKQTETPRDQAKEAAADQGSK